MTKDPENTNLALSAKKLDREEIIFVKHYFEHGDMPAALQAAGYKAVAAGPLSGYIRNPDSAIGRFYWELCKDRVASTRISTEKKRDKIWKLTEWAASISEAGKPNDGKLALQCLDMLNKMDGDYAALRIDSKQQIQKHTVSFSQGITEKAGPQKQHPAPEPERMDKAIESHAEVLERKTG